ncbi:ABC transporter ATP-binding protein [Sciscionella marina]|uniref:ABC transporter ATP-binding protein n=1 Tax=Sciscionella marina TaxID=508770 RepID=UPI000378B21E|nr:dipeptide/oligopeptide/nickel ABC transporter ATP-binding protein [Sciscionella marina]
MFIDTPAIEVAGITKTFGSRAVRPALDTVSFTVLPGYTTAVVGESGAGKTTLIRCVAGLEKPSSGEILIHGKPLVPRPGHTSPVQMVFQNPSDALDPMRSIGSSIAEPLRGTARGQRRSRVRELLSLVGINPSRAAERPRAFSGGQLQRVVVARALAPAPDVLLCDEPTSALDVSVQAQIINLLLELQEQHRFAMVLVTHDLAVAKVLADDILVLRKGTTRFYGDVHELLTPSGPLDEYVAGLVDTSRASELSSERPVPPRHQDLTFLTGA